MIICIKCGKEVNNYVGKQCMTCYIRERQDKLPKHPCGCGCGEMIPIKTMRNKPMLFKEGHQFLGERHPNWKGGRYEHKGYWYIWKPEHPFVDKRGYVPEHRLVYEEYYNVCLLPWVEIHHIEPITEDYCNNDISNLMVVTRKEHRAIDKMIDMNGRRCSDPECKDPTNPYIRKDKGNPRQKWNYINGKLVCSRCYLRWYDKNKRVRK